jgi:hypothetical protein
MPRSRIVTVRVPNIHCGDRMVFSEGDERAVTCVSLPRESGYRIVIDITTRDDRTIGHVSSKIPLETRHTIKVRRYYE